MQIDWFTFAAQAVNFLVLVALLQRLLYRPLVSAMERRQEEIDRRLEEGAGMEREARDRAEALERERRELEERREELLRAAEGEAEARRSELLEEAREEVGARRRRWQEALDRERESFLEELRGRVAEEAVAVARRALADLADADLERRAADRFVARLEGLDEAGRQELGSALKRAVERVGEEPLVESSFELPEEVRTRIVRALDDLLPGGRTVRFETSTDLGFGIELTAGGVELGWSLDRYLAGLDERVGELLSEAAGISAGTSIGTLVGTLIGEGAAAGAEGGEGEGGEGEG